MAWCRTALWIWLLAAAYERCCSSPSSFSNSLRLTRAVHSRVQQLLVKYKEEQFSDLHFDVQGIVLSTLPSFSIKYQTWLQMEDTERLYRAHHYLQSFWTHLERQRQKLQGNSDRDREGEIKKSNRQGRSGQPLPESILAIQMGLRDLMRQVNSQLLSISTMVINPTTTSSSTSRPSVPSTVSLHGSTRSGVPSVTQPRKGEPSPGTVQQNTPKSVSSWWVSALEGYIILRDLERYLVRLERDYNLLTNKS